VFTVHPLTCADIPIHWTGNPITATENTWSHCVEELPTVEGWFSTPKSQVSITWEIISVSSFLTSSFDTHLFFRCLSHWSLHVSVYCFLSVCCFWPVKISFPLHLLVWLMLTTLPTPAIKCCCERLTVHLDKISNHWMPPDHYLTGVSIFAYVTNCSQATWSREG